MKQIVFVAKHDRSFIHNDYNMLSKHYDVTRDTSKKSIQGCDVVYCWFASNHALKPLYYAHKYNKRFIVVTGGYDVAHYIGKHPYGLPNNKLLSWIPHYVLDNASLILPVSTFNMGEVRRMTDNNNVICVPNSIPVDYKYPCKENIILTVGFIDKVSYYRKGLDRFIQVARDCPAFKFYHIGKISYSGIPHDLPSNLSLLGYVDDVDKWYSKARIYCQFSRYESFGLSVIEAMNRGCIPIVWDSGALPEIVDKYGVVVDGIYDRNYLPGVISDVMYRKPLSQVESWLHQYDNSVREQKLVEIIG